MLCRHVNHIALAAALSAATAGAQQLPQSTELHGFGSWNSGATNNDNLYLGGHYRGSSRSSVAGVTLTGRLDERLTYTAQVKFEFDGTTEPSLDYVFAQYKLVDALEPRAGQVRQPFGLYTETIDIGTTRPFLSAPLAVYGPTANIAG